MSTEKNLYNLRALPPWFPWTEEDTKADSAAWSVHGGFSAPPEIGARVNGAINEFGASTVIGYFVEDGFLGVELRCDKRPAWHVKQNGDKHPHPLLFGSEIKPL